MTKLGVLSVGITIGIVVTAIGTIIHDLVLLALSFSDE